DLHLAGTPRTQCLAWILRRRDRQRPEVRGRGNRGLALLAGRFPPALGGEPLGFLAPGLFRRRLPRRLLFGGLLLGQPARGLFLLALLVRLALALQLGTALCLLFGGDLLAREPRGQLTLPALRAAAQPVECRMGGIGALEQCDQ